MNYTCLIQLPLCSGQISIYELLSYLNGIDVLRAQFAAEPDSGEIDVQLYPKSNVYESGLKLGTSSAKGKSTLWRHDSMPLPFTFNFKQLIWKSYRNNTIISRDNIDDIN